MPIDPRQIEVMDDAMAEVLRRKTGGERVRIVFGMWEMARELVRASVRAQHPDWDEPRVAAATARRLSHGAV